MFAGLRSRNTIFCKWISSITFATCLNSTRQSPEVIHMADIHKQVLRNQRKVLRNPSTCG